MKPNFCLLFTICLSLFYGLSTATSIIPPNNLGQMARYADAVVVAKMGRKSILTQDNRNFEQFDFTIQKTIYKSSGFNLNQNFHLLSLGFTTDHISSRIDGDIEFQENQEYLLFLNYEAGKLRPMMLSYGIFQLVERNNNNYFVPIPESIEFLIEEDLSYEKLKVYKADALLYQLRQYANMTFTSWNEQYVNAGISINEFHLNQRNAPSYCTFLQYGNQSFRWTGFPNFPVYLRYTKGGDKYYNGSITQVKNALNDYKINYFGINYTDGGTHEFYPLCASGTFYDNDFFMYIDNNYNSSRNALVMFNDPCEELPDLNNCFGLLAVGGVGARNEHLYDGSYWYSAAYGYVIVNDSVGACLNPLQYKLMLTHEITHTMGLGHYPQNYNNPDSSASMNPVCCRTISNLDVQCLDYVYPPIFLPIELIDFTAKKSDKDIVLNWHTASEFNNKKFEILHSTDAIHWEKLSEINGSINSQSLRSYQYIHKAPLAGEHYYQLKQIDQNQKTSLSLIVSVDIEGNFNIEIKPVSDNKIIELHITASKEKLVTIELINSLGQVLYTNTLLPRDSKIDLEIPYSNEQSSGINFLRASQNGQSISKKLN